MRTSGGSTARAPWAIPLLLACAPVVAAAQGGPPPTAQEPPPAWSGSLSGTWYLLPHEPDHGLVIAGADRAALHLEARYGYEDLRTVSAWAGWNAEVEGVVSAKIVPMFGAIAGRTSGVAPGLELTLAYGPLQYYFETEVVFSFTNASTSYFYAWSELSVAPLEWMRVGAVLQRTRVVRTDRELTPGGFVTAGWRRFLWTAYWFAPGATDQYAALSMAVSF